jgi:hypothetical protein
MAWAEQATRPLTETFDGSFEAAGAAVAAAFAQAPLIMRIAFLESGEIAGLRLLPQPERAAQPETGQPG